MDKVIDPLGAMIEQLHGDGRLRVWSLVITIFGDAIQPRGGRVSSARLQEMLGRMGIEAGALRTAMSRLAKEGWVQREREGRRTFYRLSPKGTNAFEPATRRIYAPVSEQGVDRWVMGLVPPRQRLEADIRAAGGFVLAGGGLWPEAAAPGPDWFAARGVLTVAGALGAMPEQMAAELAPGEGRAAYLRLIAGFKGLPVAQLAPLDAMAARILLIHRWRRIVLRNPDLPKAIQPADWPGDACRAFVAGLYAQLAASSDRWLDAPVAGGISALPAPDAAYRARFAQSSR